MTKTRAQGALAGAALAGLPGVAAVLGVELVNPAFVDLPFLVWALAVAAPGALGAAIGAVVKAPARRWPAALALTSAAAVFGAGIDDGVRPIEGLELLVVGIDGVTWKEVDPLVAKGDLQTLDRLRKEGASGTMKAHEPLFSPLLWASLGTGFDPEQHGIRGFKVHATDTRVPRFFDIAEYGASKRIGMYKWLVTWPPRELEHGGFMVPAWLAPSPETAPPELSFIKEIELSRRLKRQRTVATRSAAELGWEGITHGFRFSTAASAAVWSLRERFTRPREEDRERDLNFLRAAMDHDVFLWSMRHYQPSVASFTYYQTDALGHVFWKYHEPEKFPGVPPDMVAEYGEAVRDAYRQSDAFLATFLRLVPEGGRVVVVSDHGFQALDERTGALASPKTGHLEQRLNAEVGPIQIARVGTKITLVPDCADGAPPECAPDLRARALTWVEGRIQKSTGETLYKWEPVPDDPNALAIKLRQEHLPESLLTTDTVDGEPLSEWVGKNEHYSGDHDPYGIFVAWGPGVTPGATANVDILDVAPTLLAAIGLPKGADMVGTVPDSVWDAPPPGPSWAPIMNKLKYPGQAPKEDDVNTEMLEALGYIEEQ
jgi:hypothetical protein